MIFWGYLIPVAIGCILLGWHLREWDRKQARQQIHSGIIPPATYRPKPPKQQDWFNCPKCRTTFEAIHKGDWLVACPKCLNDMRNVLIPRPIRRDTDD